MTDTNSVGEPSAHEEIDFVADAKGNVEASEVKESDPTLSRVGDHIDEAKDAAREIFGERDDEARPHEDGPDEDLGGAAPVP